MTRNYSIKELDSQDRPREKLMEHGASYLTDAELIAIIIGSGTKHRNAVETAIALLKEKDNNLTEIAAASPEDLCTTEGIGPAKAVAILAAAELGKRVLSARKSDGTTVTDSTSVGRIFIPLMKSLDHEEFWVVYLNRANRIIKKERISIGGAFSTVVDIKIVVRKVVSVMAQSVILVHNHPSGNPKPGGHDMKVTENMKKALKVFEVTLLDHIVIAGDTYCSFADEGIL